MTEFQQSHDLPNNSSDKWSHVIWPCFVFAGTRRFPELSADDCRSDAPLLQRQRGCLCLTWLWRKAHSCLLREHRTKMNERDAVYMIPLPISAECPNNWLLERAKSGSLATSSHRDTTAGTATWTWWPVVPLWLLVLRPPYTCAHTELTPSPRNRVRKEFINSKMIGLCWSDVGCGRTSVVTSSLLTWLVLLSFCPMFVPPKPPASLPFLALRIYWHNILQASMRELHLCHQHVWGRNCSRHIPNCRVSRNLLPAVVCSSRANLYLSWEKSGWYL